LTFQIEGTHDEAVLMQIKQLAIDKLEAFLEAL
jgi:hypothetical protein